MPRHLVSDVHEWTASSLLALVSHCAHHDQSVCVIGDLALLDPSTLGTFGCTACSSTYFFLFSVLCFANMFHAGIEPVTYGS